MVPGPQFCGFEVTTMLPRTRHPMQGNNDAMVNVARPSMNAMTFISEPQGGHNGGSTS